MTNEIQGIILFDNDSLEPLKFWPKDDELRIASRTNDQYSTIRCSITNPGDTDCSGPENLGEVVSQPGPSISEIRLESLGNLIIAQPLAAGGIINIDLQRNSNYTVSPSGYIPFNIITPESQKNYSYQCWNQADYDVNIMNGTLTKISALQSTTQMVCDFPGQ